MAEGETEVKKIKCVVWDLDNTLWDGVLLEDENVTLHEDFVQLIKVMDSRGILQSVASKNEYNVAMKKLEEFGLAEYFLYPQIGWNTKSSFIQNIAKSINIGIDTIAFVDDQEFERDEVRHMFPQVLCIDAEFNSTDRNRIMYVTYKFAGFKEIQEKGSFVVFENDLSNINAMPDYIKLNLT
ncbi:HAD-IIIC family phosphatase [Ruminiclostridium papyrosolvens]|uniref:Magnesium-dependent phosphatase-1 n=1 Tax=Ruminiclostridium papyrosolvens C7 TaxID=1330534 RepID=U4R1H8_9FIRM|nr:HAD-IIIC family phosphatase [Ruminiclostridium papyrosolvens]EPR12031.1 hypothetical protein L323_09745 [Ruminiclostridium papyrosolvens C7]